MHQGDEQPGESFENMVAAVWRLVPGARVERRKRLAGKSVDVLVTLLARLGYPSQTIAVECKDYSRRLSRRDLAEILADYDPLVRNNTVNALYIVTRAGIVDNAASALDGVATVHMTYGELLHSVMDVTPLAQAMRDQFSEDSLDRYYEPLLCKSIDIKRATSDFDTYHSPFVEYVAAAYSPDKSHQDENIAPQKNSFEEVMSDRLTLRYWRTRWTSLCEAGGRNDQVACANLYTPAQFRQIVKAKVGWPPVDLAETVMSWVHGPSTGVGLALLGSYGTGKTTFARFIAAKLAREFLSGKGTERVPVLIELRHLTSDQDIDALMTHYLADRFSVEGANFSRFQAMNRAGSFVIILDGFDEMRSGMSREAIAHNFNEINKLCVGHSRVLLCGRPTLFESSEEEAAYLRSSGDVPLEQACRYAPIHVMPLEAERILPVARAYLLAQGPERAKTQLRLDDLDSELQRNDELRDLLRRPVHIPMLLRVLPKWRQPLATLHRSALYLRFIELSIQREVGKRGVVHLYSVDDRLSFASALACAMWRSGQSREIAVSSIPQELLERYRKAGRTLDATRRELVAACFLESKPPDQLLFGHKSYLEFLVALALSRGVVQGVRAFIGESALSPEIGSFLSELLVATDLADALQEGSSGEEWLEALLTIWERTDSTRPSSNAPALADLLLNSAVVGAVTRVAEVLPARVMFAFAELCEKQASLLDHRDDLRGLLEVLLVMPEDYISVHAWRALRGAHCDEDSLLSLIGPERIGKWRKLGWVEG